MWATAALFERPEKGTWLTSISHKVTLFIKTNKYLFHFSHEKRSPPQLVYRMLCVENKKEIDKKNYEKEAGEEKRKEREHKLQDVQSKKHVSKKKQRRKNNPQHPHVRLGAEIAPEQALRGHPADRHITLRLHGVAVFHLPATAPSFLGLGHEKAGQPEVTQKALPTVVQQHVPGRHLHDVASTSRPHPAVDPILFIDSHTNVQREKSDGYSKENIEEKRRKSCARKESGKRSESEERERQRQENKRKKKAKRAREKGSGAVFAIREPVSERSVTPLNVLLVRGRKRG